MDISRSKIPRNNDYIFEVIWIKDFYIMSTYSIGKVKCNSELILSSNSQNIQQTELKFQQILYSDIARKTTSEQVIDF